MKQIICCILLFSIYFGTFAPFVARAQRSGGKISMGDGEMFDEMTDETTKNGLDFRLSEGTPEAEKREIQRQIDAQKLSEAETSNLLKRIPEIKEQTSDKQNFAKRAGTLPPPKTGKIVPVKFPADENRAAPNANNSNVLSVLRFSPNGDVPLVSDLSVTFSQPMIAVTSQEQAAQTVPVRLSPDVKGRWRWLGTKTLIFDAEQRFPMATKFTASVPAGTKSATGANLDKETSWAFQTPPPTVQQFAPSGGLTVKPDALMFVSFDQEINPGAVLDKILINGKKIALRLATNEEISADASVNYYSKNTLPNRWLAFRAADKLPSDSPIAVVVAAGTPSAEGPLTTTKPQNAGNFKTYGAMKFVKAFCSYEGATTCSPFDNWYFQFTNQIDAAAFAENLVSVAPELKDLDIIPGGNSITISGYKPGRKTYKITVNQGVKDVFGQVTDKPATASFAVGGAEPSFSAQGENMIVLDPSAKPNYSVYTVNHQNLKVQIRRVTPNDWEGFRAYKRFDRYDNQKQPALPGTIVFDKTVALEKKLDELVETRIDLSAALDGGFGHAIITVEPTIKRSEYDNQKVVVWAQSTNIGLDAFVDNQELVGFATELKTGKPLDDVQMRIYPNNGEEINPTSEVQSPKPENNRTWMQWLNSFVAAEPQESAEFNKGQRTNNKGLFKFALPATQPKQSILIATRSKDTAFLPESADYYWQENGFWFRKPDLETLRWFVFTDRNMYRPKEEVAFKGYIRKVTAGKFADIADVGEVVGGANYIVRDAQGNEIAKGTTQINAFGAFDFKFKLADNVNLGNANVQITTNLNVSNNSTYQNFQIQEFRRPEFEVTAKNETSAPYFVGNSANVSVEAKYFAGGALPNAETNWTVRATPTNFTPPNRGDFNFGKWFPWWRSYGENYGGTTTQYHKGVTGADGKHLLKIDFVTANPARPYTVAAEANVQDVNRQTFASSTNLLVHPSEFYIGIRLGKNFVNPGEKFTVESIVSDLDGKLIANRDANIKAVLKDWVYEKNEWTEKTVDEQTCNFKSIDGVAKCDFVAKQGGVYTITATVLDDRERKNESELTLWVSGGKSEPKRTIEKESANLIPDKKEYAANDTAEILVQTPFVPAEGVLTLRRNGIVKTERFTMTEASKVLKIKLEERFLPNINVQVDLVGAADRFNDAGEIEKGAKRPAFASGELNLPISTASRKLNVTAEPTAKNLEPGGTTDVKVEVKDNNGEPVANSEIAVIVVDESVLALSNYNISDPLSIFYQQIAANVTDYHSREKILLANSDDIKNVSESGSRKRKGLFTGGAVMQEFSVDSMARPAPMMARSAAKESAADKDDAGQQNNAPINLRSNFEALAVFASSVKTDSDGRATINVKLPDNLTRYRVTAISVDSSKKFGKGESAITAKQPLMVRPSAPRFMNFGDKIELPVVIQNQTDKAMTVDVAVRATNAELTNGGGRKVVIAANDRAEVRFPVSAVKAGIARFQIATTSGNFADAAEINLPVWTPATTEAFATYGTTDQNEAIVQPIQTPRDVWAEFGGLEVTTSSTQLQELTDAFIYLQDYPYGCSEQISSRMISTAALRDVLQAFKAAGMPTPEVLKRQFADDIETLKGRQRDDGSFGLWSKKRERYEYPYVSINVAHALARAKQKGYEVPNEMFARSQNYLKNINNFIPKDYSQESRWAIQSYALYVRNLMNDKDAAEARKVILMATIEKLSMESLGWLLNVLNGDAKSVAQIEAIRLHFNNRAVETAGAANFVENYTDGREVLLHSNRRSDGIILEALINNQPNNDLIPKIVRGLLANKTKGRWANTQENVFILLALDRYFAAFESVTPNFVAGVWLGDAYAGEQKFSGREVDFKQIDVPMNYLLQGSGLQNLVVQRQGAGRLYYRIGMKYAPKNLKLAPADYGFEVTRKYEAIDAPDDVKQNADGTWTIKAGAKVRVRISMVAPSRRYHVALVDPLPAGLEIMNPELAVTGSLPPDVSSGNRRGYWNWTWFDHQNFRDERAEAFSSLLWEGVWNYTYVARATTPGEFVVPPAKAEEMYAPETFGRSGTDFVRVE